jgi:gliding motility-associated-like protein
LLTAITACDSLVYNTPTSTTFYRDTTLIRLAQTAQGCTNSIQQPIIIHYSRTDTLPSIIACDSIFIQGIMCKRDTIFINNSFTNNGCILRNIQPIIINNSSTLLLTPITGCDSVVYNNTFFKRDTTLFAQAQNPQGCILYLQQPIHIYNSEIVTLSQLSACDSLLYNSVMYYKDTIIKTFDTTLQGCIKTILQPLVIRYLNIDITGVPALNCNTRTTTLTATANGYPYTGSFNALYYWLNQVNGAQNTISTAGIYTIRIRSPFCLKEKSIEVIDAPPLTANVSLTDAICHNDPVTLTAINITNAIPLGSTRYQLDNNLPITDSIFTNMQAGWHTIKVSDARNCVWSSSLYVSNPPLITLDLGNDKTIHLGDTIRFNPQLNSYTSVSYAWSSSFGMPLYLSCDNCRRPVAIPLQNITYTATVTDANGCKITDNIDINIIDDYEVYIPNVFTPNNDGKNDLFTAYGGRSVSNIALMQIFDRWGVLIYEAKNLPINSNDYKNAWDGTYKDTELNPAVFVYSIKIKFINGFERIYTGDIMLVR